MHGDSVLVEREQDRLRLHAGHAEAEDVRKRSVAVAFDAFDDGRDRVGALDERALLL
jgi:hypothetical protein